MSVVKKAFQAVGLAPKVNVPKTQVPAQQLERQSDVGAEDITIGSDDNTSGTTKGKRGLVRPVASSLGM